MNKLPILIVAGVLAVVAVSGCTSVPPVTGDISENTVSTGPGLFSIPVSEISSQAEFYSFNTNGKEVRFFAVKGSDGEIRTAFDACDVCGGKKGYAQKGNDMVCRNCDRYFSIDSIGTANRGGGCWPSFLSHEISDNSSSLITI